MLPGLKSAIIAGADTLGLTLKGYGYTEKVTGSLTLIYSNVQSGSAPVAGDLVVWMGLGLGKDLNNLTGAGWAQTNANDGGLVFSAGILAKVLTAGDISSPATLMGSAHNGLAGMWIAFSVTGAISSISAGAVNATSLGVSAPASKSLNSAGAGALTINVSAGLGTDGSISTAWSGATPDINFQRNDVVSSGTTEVHWMAKLIALGANITVSKGDDGSNNGIATGYVAVN